jgi:hypothetical protein
MPSRQKLPPKELDLRAALHQERLLFEKVAVPIVTVSATFRKELADRYQSLVHTPADVIYSRGHYSMAEAVRQQALALGKTVQLSDPTNFVSKKDWKKIEFTEKVGRLTARNKLLKAIKDRLNSVMRGNLPITKAITPPLLYLTGTTPCPIISMHYETGNILTKAGKVVVQAVTDPHVHTQYLAALPSPNITYAVFDQQTKSSLLKQARELKKEVSDDQVVVTGPFVDPRIAALGIKEKKIAKGVPVNLAVTTGGLGTNLNEIKAVLKKFEPLLVPPEKIRLFLYASTHADFRDFFEDFARENHIRIGNLDDQEARIRVLYDDSIVDANENLIKYMFPWAHGIITKPSGDMAYDGAAAGCFLLFLKPWGDWEESVKNIFQKNGVGRTLDLDCADQQLRQLMTKGDLADSLKAAHKLPPLFREGCQSLLKLHSEKPCATVNKRN